MLAEFSLIKPLRGPGSSPKPPKKRAKRPDPRRVDPRQEAGATGDQPRPEGQGCLNRYA